MIKVRITRRGAKRYRVTKTGEGPFIVVADRFEVTTVTQPNSAPGYHARFYTGTTLVAFVNYPGSIVDVTA